MLSTINGKAVTSVPYREKFDGVIRRLGPTRTSAVRAELTRLVDLMQPDPQTGLRTFSSSHLGSALTPWQPPLQNLYDVAWEISGSSADEQDVQGLAAQIFGQFVWESIMERTEEWVFYDPNLSSTDPNREITGKVYFERES
jgi:hypothetical protein